jgi:hypothetical protein
MAAKCVVCHSKLLAKVFNSREFMIINRNG